MMKIALIRPNYRSHIITPPLGIGYLSSFLKNRGIDTVVIDGLSLGISNREVASRCFDRDIVGISCLTDYFKEAACLSRELKSRGKTVVLGGPHASSLPQLALDESGADYVITGEGERGFYELIRELAHGGETLDQRIRKGVEIGDIDTLPLPDWRQIDPRKYKHAPHGGVIKSFPAAPVISSRGCVFECKFCASPSLWSRRVRLRSPGSIVDEIEYLLKEFAVREIHFEDDNFTFSLPHAVGVCEGIIKRGLKVNWALPNGIRVTGVNADIFRLMKRSGCYYVAFGIESGNQEILDGISKGIKLDDVERAVEMAHRAGLMTQGFFIFGLPGETERSIKETLDFSKRIALDRAQFLFLDPLPGSRLWQELSVCSIPAKKGRSFQEVKWVPPTVDAETLKKAVPMAFRSFFLRRKQMGKIVRYIRLGQIPSILRRIRDFNMTG